MKSRQAKFEAWLRDKRCPRCREAALIPKNPRYDRKFRCCHCGLLGKIVRKGGTKVEEFS